MGTDQIKRSDALKGELVTIVAPYGEAQVGYLVGESVYVVENERNAVKLESSVLSGSTYHRDHGRGFIEWIRHKRKTAATPYKVHPASLSSLNDRQLEAFDIMKKNGGIISRKDLADRMQITTNTASKLMHALLNEALVSIDIENQTAYFTNSADHV